jgi:hypothetical protein
MAQKYPFPPASISSAEHRSTCSLHPFAWLAAHDSKCPLLCLSDYSLIVLEQPWDELPYSARWLRHYVVSRGSGFLAG